MIKTLDIFAGLVLVLVAAIFLVSVMTPRDTHANVLAYAVPKVATSSTMVVGPQSVTTLSGNTSTCTARLISTVASPIMLSFGGAITPTGAVGHLQAASTTALYDNGNYGCGAITAYGFASSTITVTAFSQ